MSGSQSRKNGKEVLFLWNRSPPHLLNLLISTHASDIIVTAMNHPFHMPQDDVRDFCQRHHIRKLSIFGSALRPDFGPDSDVDILVEFEEGHTPGFGFFDMEIELSRILGRTVDLNTPGFLSHFFRDRVLREAKVQYAVA